MAEEGTIKVHIGDLKDMAGRLAGLKDEFEGMKELAQHSRDIFGSAEVADQFGNFATNWSDARGKLCEQLTQVAGYADSAADHYQAQEDALVNATQGRGGEGG
jgi:hypothetical protein